MSNNNSSSGSPMTTMLLMGAVILLFMWLNRPKADQAQTADELNSSTELASGGIESVTADTLTAAQVANIVNVVRQNGVADTTSNTYTLRTGESTLTVGADSRLSGSVGSGGETVSIAELLTSNHTSVSPKAAATAIGVLLADVNHAARYQGFARYTTGDSTAITLENDKVKLEISNKGGMISRATLKEYNRFDSTAVELMAPDLGGYAFTLTTANQRFQTDEFYFTPMAQTDSSIVMQLDLGEGAVWGLRYTLLPGSYCVKMEIVQSNMQKVLPPSTAEMDFNWHETMQRNEAGRMFEERNSALYYKYSGGDVENLSESKKDDEDITEKVQWIGFKNQFFSSILVAHNNFNSAQLESDVLENNPDCLKTMAAATTFDYNTGAEVPATFVFYLGPNSYPILSDLEDEVIEGRDMEFTRLIPLGWSLFRWINTLIVIPVFTFLGQFISNYGIIILILTLFIKLILFPFTYKSYMSQAKMRVLTPEINAINEKYPGNENAMKRQQETMALYSRAGASPFSGCLPLLLQMPILVAMFNFFPSAIELRGEPFLWAKDLSAPDAIWSWKTNIWLLSSTFGNHVSLFCLLMTITNIVYTKINMQSQPGGANTMPAMKWMMYLMPLMFLFWFNNYASGLSYYYLLSLLITIIQTYIFRKVVNEDKVRAQMRENAKKPRKKSGFMARLEEAQRRQQQLLREQEKQRRR